MNVWKRCHRGSDLSNPDKLCNPMAEARLVSYWQTFVIFSLLLVLSPLQFASPCRKSIRKKWWKHTAKASTTRRSPLTAGPSMTAEVEKHMDSEINALFSLTLWMRDTNLLLLLIAFFWRFALFDGVLDSREQCHRGKVCCPRLLILRLVYLICT
jgi:hypothetical protein